MTNLTHRTLQLTSGYLNRSVWKHLTAAQVSEGERRPSDHQEPPRRFRQGFFFPGCDRRRCGFPQRRLFSSSPVFPSDEEEALTKKQAQKIDSDDSASASAVVTSVHEDNKHQRIWLPDSFAEPLYWSEEVGHEAQQNTPQDLTELLERVEAQDLEGGRMRSKQFGVLHEDPSLDMRLLTEKYSVTSLASALRDREEALQYCAQLAEQGDTEALQEYLHTYHPKHLIRRRNRQRQLDVTTTLTAASLETIRKALMRMPRRVVQAYSQRAGVVIAIVHVDGVPSLLLEKRSPSLRAHPDEVCLPGGMVCSEADKTIVETCLREMKEEIGGLDFDYHQAGGSEGVTVLGVLRCNWGEVHHMVGLAVTPVVCCFGQDLAEVDLKPSPDEVAEVFTIPLASLMDRSLWVYKEDHAPIFVGGPYVIWGLTGFLLEKFWKDVLLPYSRHTPFELDH